MAKRCGTCTHNLRLERPTLTAELSSEPTTMCAAGRAETFWASICDTPCDFPLRVLIVSLRGRPSPRLLGVAASGSARHAMSASCARLGVHDSPCVLNTGRLAGKARLAWGRSRSYGVTLGTVSLSRRHAYLCRSVELRRGYELWVCLNVLIV